MTITLETDGFKKNQWTWNPTKGKITYQLLEQVLFTSPDLVATWLPTLTQVEQLDLSYRLEQQGL